MVFAGDETAEFRRVASSATALYSILFIAAGPNHILSAYLQSLGKSTVAALINLLKGFVFVALLLVLLPGYFQMGLRGIWLSRSLAEILTLLLIGTYIFCNKEHYHPENVMVTGE